MIVQTQTQNHLQVLQEKKKLKKKKPKSKKDIAIKKAKATKAEGGEELDISKFCTILEVVELVSLVINGLN